MGGAVQDVMPVNCVPSAIYGIVWLVKWPPFGPKYDFDKWLKEIVPWLRARNISYEMKPIEGGIGFRHRRDAVLFKLSWFASDFQKAQ